jgi:16S rRNA (guanine527-N7)-methyltransferase
LTRSLEVAERLNAALETAGIAPLDSLLADRFATYLSLILRWNQRINLTAIRDEQGIFSRHFAESIACAGALPRGILTLLDLGSGAGFPGIPISLCRPDISVTLAESQGKKAAFLQEAVRVLGLSARVLAARAESESQLYDCVVLRAVDRMAEAVGIAAGLVGESGWLALMTTVPEATGLQSAAGPQFIWDAPIPLPGSGERIIVLGQRELQDTTREALLAFELDSEVLRATKRAMTRASASRDRNQDWQSMGQALQGAGAPPHSCDLSGKVLYECGRIVASGEFWRVPGAFRFGFSPRRPLRNMRPATRVRKSAVRPCLRSPQASICQLDGGQFAHSGQVRRALDQDSDSGSFRITWSFIDQLLKRFGRRAQADCFDCAIPEDESCSETPITGA